MSESLDDATIAELIQALLDKLVIFFRHQRITPEQQIAFARRFGELHIHPYIPRLEGYPGILALTCKEDGPGDMAYQSNTWHTDLTYEAEPPKACVLRGVEVPAASGDTMWNNLYGAYDALSDPMMKFLDGMTAVHYIAISMPADFLDRITRQSKWRDSMRLRRRSNPPSFARILKSVANACLSIETSPPTLTVYGAVRAMRYWHFCSSMPSSLNLLCNFTGGKIPSRCGTIAARSIMLWLTTTDKERCTELRFAAIAPGKRQYSNMPAGDWHEYPLIRR